MAKKLYLLSLFFASAAVTGYGGFFVFDRIEHAHQVVVKRNTFGENRGRLALAKETAIEAFKGTRPAPGKSGMPDSSAFPGSSGVTVAEFDKRDMEELKREGIDLDCVAEIRTAMRTVLTDPDPEARMRMTVELKKKFGLVANPDMLARLDRLENGELKPTWTKKGSAFIRSVAGAVYVSYLAMLEKLTE